MPRTAAAVIPQSWLDQLMGQIDTYLQQRVGSLDEFNKVRLGLAEVIKSIPDRLEDEFETPYLDNWRSYFTDAADSMTWNYARDTWNEIGKCLAHRNPLWNEIGRILREKLLKAAPTFGNQLDMDPKFNDKLAVKLVGTTEKELPPEAKEELRGGHLGPNLAAHLKATKWSGKVLRLLKSDSPGPTIPERVMKVFKDMSRFWEERGTPDDDGVVRSFYIGKMKVLIGDPSNRPERDKAFIQEVKEAERILKSNKMDHLWYGVLALLHSEKSGELSEDVQERLRARGVDVSKWHGQMMIHSNIILISGWGPHLHTILHELGHRQWFKFMSQDDRAKFNSLVSTRNLPEKKAPASVPADDDESLDLVPGPRDDQGRDKPVLPVSEYGGSNSAEAFAEVFADYMMKKRLDYDQRESFRAVMHMAGLRSEVTRLANEMPELRRYLVPLLA